MQAFDPAPLSRIVEDHNEREGFRGDDSPFSVAKRQPQLDAALLYLHVVDEIHDEVAATMKRLGFREQVQQASEDDDCGWNLVRSRSHVYVGDVDCVPRMLCTLLLMRAARALSWARKMSTRRAAAVLLTGVAELDHRCH